MRIPKWSFWGRILTLAQTRLTAWPFGTAGSGHTAFSLNIFKELNEDLGCYIPNNGYLVPWARQGVLLLNTSLTVVAGRPNSHRNKGWEKLTDRIIELLNEKESPVVFLLWGNNAKSKTSLITNKNHLVLTTVHPSPLSASRGFFGCRHFSKANKFLMETGQEPVDWQIPNI